MKDKIEIFVELGRRLRCRMQSVEFDAIAESATAANGWFMRRDIECALDAIINSMLSAERLGRWLGRYGDYTPPVRKNVAVIMAGNIPLVGFFDMMCVLICGHNCVVKTSHKDDVLIRFVIDELRGIDPAIRITYFDDKSTVDAVIATGSDNTNRYFKSRFGSIPSLLRGNRHSLAVVGGSMSEQMWAALSADVSMYSGLGCRSVSLIFVPRGEALKLSPGEGSMNEKYMNGYRQTRALMQMRGADFVDLGWAVAVEERGFSNNICQINYSYYDSMAEVAAWIEQHRSSVQCVVGQGAGVVEAVEFGRAQHPELWDYADGKDVINFLTDI